MPAITGSQVTCSRRGRRIATAAVVSATVVIALSAPRARGAVIAWDDPFGGRFQDPTNWFPAAVPGPADTVHFQRFPDSTTYTVTFSDHAATSALTVRNNVTFDLGTRSYVVANRIDVETGSIALTGGTLQSGETRVGTLATGPATFTHNAGTHSVGPTGASQMTVGYNAAGGERSIYNLNGGTLSAFAVNYGTLNNAGGTLTGGVENHGTYQANGGAPRAVGSLTNMPGATFRATGADLTMSGVTNRGAFIGDGATYHITGTVGAFDGFSNVGSGYVSAGAGDRFLVAGSFDGATDSRTQWNTAAAELRFTDNGPSTAAHELFLNGRDMGPEPAGYANNFAWGTLALDPGEGLALVAPPFGTREALYVGVLSLGDGLGQLDRIDSNGFNIYYDATRPENAYLGGEPHALAEGGALIPVPEPGAAALGLVAAIRLLRRRRTGAEPVGP